MNEFHPHDHTHAHDHAHPHPHTHVDAHAHQDPKPDTAGSTHEPLPSDLPTSSDARFTGGGFRGTTPPPMQWEAMSPSRFTPPAPPAPKAPLIPIALGATDPQLIERVTMVLKTVYDPEIPVNIHELGMIYEVRADTSGEAYVRMTLTSPACPVAGSLPGEVERKVASVHGVQKAQVELVWEPAWSMALISEAARLQLNLPG